ncbi:hypothetical protein GCM10008107_26570 [Psychrosphaera saromensis]|uniref:Uncharacterized protein n=1 Tax=Psychrosphaera saromensis TaxID=716813 RepID=A0A2S7UVJ9_9GAMM|nr:hypothetical protein [Psychrosphaera saromensis]PQJ53973.1 hypothetical protein BTO11_10110 [Psychrosphaera saromensis]GHB75836.1 hypothetical protein GCM10008107_26570 [Psychrosphaera saromensis]GLQ14540.1 hypothetical protein GCM10007917_19950 [Psychrosphaera saromensis]
MKLLTLLFGALVLFNTNAQSVRWEFRESGTNCHFYSSGRLDINENEVIQYSVGFAIVSKEHDISEYLKSINLKPNEYVLQFSLGVYSSADKFGFLGDKLDVPLQLKVNGISLESYENEYGTTFYIRGENAKQILSKLTRDKTIPVKASVGNIEHSIPLSTGDVDFVLKSKLLKTCENHFISKNNE